MRSGVALATNNVLPQMMQHSNHIKHKRAGSASSDPAFEGRGAGQPHVRSSGAEEGVLRNHASDRHHGLKGFTPKPNCTNLRRVAKGQRSQRSPISDLCDRCMLAMKQDMQFARARYPLSTDLNALSRSKAPIVRC